MRKNSHQKWDRATISTDDSASAIVSGVKKKQIVRRSCPSATPTRMELSQSWAEQLTFEERSGWDGETLLLPFSFPSSFSLFPFPFHSLSLSLSLPRSHSLWLSCWANISFYWYIQLSCIYWKGMSVCIYVCGYACVCWFAPTWMALLLFTTPEDWDANLIAQVVAYSPLSLFQFLRISVIFVKTFRLLGCIALWLDVTLRQLEELIRMRGWLQLLFIRSR